MSTNEIVATIAYNKATDHLTREQLREREDQVRDTYDRLVAQGNEIADALAIIRRASTSTDGSRTMLLGLLASEHPYHLDAVATTVVRSIAQRDPDRVDGRFSDNLQRAADGFRA